MTVLLPPGKIGIIGGGQLGLMLAQSAQAMGYQVGILDPDPEAPAMSGAQRQFVGAYDDDEQLSALAQWADVLTFEFENIDVDTLSRHATPDVLPQGTDLLTICSNRVREKTFLRSHGIPVTPFLPVLTADELAAAVPALGLPAILKTASGGYDGHGQVDLNTNDDLAAGKRLLAQAPCILERRQDFDRELAVMVTRDQFGTVRVFPIVENHHQHHILHETHAPAIVSTALANEVDKIAQMTAQGLQLRGILGIEFFAHDDEVVVNELAPRPHNSGHYSIEACNLSQFDVHIRSICGLPIPEIELLRPVVMRNLLGEAITRAKDEWVKHPEWQLHDYGKREIRAGRKMGHLTVLEPTAAMSHALETI